MGEGRFANEACAEQERLSNYLLAIELYIAQYRAYLAAVDLLPNTFCILYDERLLYEVNFLRCHELHDDASLSIRA